MMEKSMSNIIKILMERDGISETEARELIREAQEELEACNYSPVECEDIMLDILGLEVDYLFDVLLGD